MGLAEIALGRWEAADDHLDEALAASPDPWIKKNQGTLREALDGVKAQFGAIQVLGEPSGADVVIDGRVIGKLPMAEPARVRPGEYRLEVRAEGCLTARRDVSVSARALRRETLTLVATRPFAALEVGYGYIKHGVLFSGDKTCGISGDARCLEAVSGGPYLAGAAFGVLFEVVRSFGFLLSASAQLGLPKFTVNLDANAGVAMRF